MNSKTGGIEEQTNINTIIILLEEKGPQLGFPYSSGIDGSEYGHMRELRIQHKWDSHRILYAFDPRRVAILLIAGNKTGDDRWYEKYVPIADRLYGEHLKQLKNE